MQPTQRIHMGDRLASYLMDAPTCDGEDCYEDANVLSVRREVRRGCSWRIGEGVSCWMRQVVSRFQPATRRR